MYHSNGEHNSNHPTRSSSLIAFKELHLQEGSTSTNEDFAESCWLCRPAAQVFQMSATLAADVSCILYPNFMELQFLQPPPLPHPPNSSTPRWSAIPIVTSGITSSKTNRLWQVLNQGTVVGMDLNMFKLLSYSCPTAIRPPACNSILCFRRHPVSAAELQNGKFYTHEKPWWSEDRPNQPEVRPHHTGSSCRWLCFMAVFKLKLWVRQTWPAALRIRCAQVRARLGV